MERGAFALIDCLGFKGIWKQLPEKNPQLLIDQLERINNEIKIPESSINQLVGSPDRSGVRLKIQLLSDTVAIGVFFDPPMTSKEDNFYSAIDGALVYHATRVVTQVMDLFLRNTVRPLVMRGSISFGNFVFKDNFIAGEAVDRAAEHEKYPDGAFVWLLPEAEQPLNKMLSVHDHNLLNINPSILTWFKRNTNKHVVDMKYPMPLKGGGFIECPVLNPLANAADDDQRNEIVRLYSEAMQRDPIYDRIDIIVKRQNTLRMLEKSFELANEQKRLQKEFNIHVPAQFT